MLHGQGVYAAVFEQVFYHLGNNIAQLNEISSSFSEIFNDHAIL